MEKNKKPGPNYPLSVIQLENIFSHFVDYLILISFAFYFAFNSMQSHWPLRLFLNISWILPLVYITS